MLVIYKDYIKFGANFMFSVYLLQYLRLGGGRPPSLGFVGT